MTNMFETKILATIGPASESESMLSEMVGAGANGFRINMSHAGHKELREKTKLIRSVSSRLGIPVAVVADLCGPKIRVGNLENGRMVLEEGKSVVLGRDIPLTHPDVLKDVNLGQRILLDDGKIELVSKRKLKNGMKTLVRTGGVLLQGKGVNFPDTPLSLPALTEKDIRDLGAAVKAKVDYICLSFVQRPDDVRSALELTGKGKGRPLVISKIEKPQAVDDFDGILELSDAIMVARGDLGVEVSPARVPVLQKDLIRRTNAAGKTVITATQMLESMVDNPRPTRAEASDVANAVWDGTDAVMLSGETAMGRYPLETIRMMRSIISEAEKAAPPRREVFTGGSPVHALASASVQAAEELKAQAIVVITVSGYTAQMVVQKRPTVPVIAVVPDMTVCNQLALLWGVTPVVVEWTDNSDDFLSEMERVLHRGDHVPVSRTAVFVSGSTKLKGTDYIMKIRYRD